MTTKTVERRKLLQRWFGKKTSEQVEAAMQSMQTALDKAGVERKEYDPSKTKAMLEELVEKLNGVFGEITDNVPEDLAARVIAEVMGAVGDAMPEETMQEDEPLPDEEEEEVPEEFRELTKQVTALAKESQDVYAEMKEFVPAFIKVADAVESLVPAASKVKSVDGFEARLEKLETAMNSRPRQASKTAGTVVENDDIKRDIQKGTEGEKTILGIRVKEN